MFAEGDNPDSILIRSSRAHPISPLSSLLVTTIASKALVPNSELCYYSSKALVTTSEALVTSFNLHIRSSENLPVTLYTTNLHTATGGRKPVCFAGDGDVTHRSGVEGQDSSHIRPALRKAGG